MIMRKGISYERAVAPTTEPIARPIVDGVATCAAQACWSERMPWESQYLSAIVLVGTTYTRRKTICSCPNHQPSNRSHLSPTQSRNGSKSIGQNDQIESSIFISQYSGDDATEEGRPVHDGNGDRKSTRLNSSHSGESRMPSSA